MEQDRKEQAPGPAEAWDLAAQEKEKVAANEAVEAKDKVLAGGRGRAAAGGRGKAMNKISRLSLRKELSDARWR